MDKNLFELLVYTFSLFGDYDYTTSSYDFNEYKEYSCLFYNSPMYKGFNVEITSNYTFTDAAEAILDAFNKRMED